MLSSLRHRFVGILAVPFYLVGDDYPDAFIPEQWANESIAILEENMVIGNLVHRDFENTIQDFGDVVNTRKPGEFTAKRKQAADSVTIQANTATNVPVTLNQHWHTSFIIKDSDQSKAFKDLVVEYLSPAMLSIARAIDLTVSGQVHQFHANNGGLLLGMDANNSDDYLLDTREVMNLNKAYENNRRLILGTRSETTMLKNANFTQAYAVGDDGTALREANLGRKYGLDIFAAQNEPYVAPGNTVVLGAINNGNITTGSTALTVDGLSAAITNGTWFTIAGEGTPLRVVSTTGGATPTAIVAHRGLRRDIVDGAVVTLYTPGTINNSGGYAAGYDGQLTVAGFSVAPRVGQPVSFTASATTAVYCIIQVSGTTGIVLDRPLEVAVADTDKVNIGPAGSYNFAFHRNAVALVVRPLALPMSGTGARAGVSSYNGLSMRVVMTYDGTKQGHLVTVDTLMGVKVLDTALGAVLYG